MLALLARVEAFLREIGRDYSPDERVNLLAEELRTKVLTFKAELGLFSDAPPGASPNGCGERGEAARGAEPRPPIRIEPDFGAARVLCACGNKFALRDARPLTHFVACPVCKRVVGKVYQGAFTTRVENVLRPASRAELAATGPEVRS